ncbi:MAG: dihydrofolate reductase [Bacteroidaceae bacterium]|nr:dihydrofolate reductase [Bacteroidaceae bacterium]
MKVTIIAAVAANGAIGYQNKLLYWLPNDLKRFKALTTGHTIIMGRRTFESLPKGALPNRRNIVLSKNAHFIAPNAEIYTSLDEALEVCKKQKSVLKVYGEEAKSEQKVNCNGAESEQKVNCEVFIIGGASVYAEALPLADRLCLTLVEDTPVAADAFFPAIDPTEWRITMDERHEADERHAHAYRFVDYKRIERPTLNVNR